MAATLDVLRSEAGSVSVGKDRTRSAELTEVPARKAAVGPKPLTRVEKIDNLAARPALCDDLRDVVRQAAPDSVKAAERSPIGDAGWPTLATRVWSTIEVSIGAGAWRAVAAWGEPISSVVPAALLPIHLAVQRPAEAAAQG